MEDLPDGVSIIYLMNAIQQLTSSWIIRSYVFNDQQSEQVQSKATMAAKTIAVFSAAPT